MPQIEFRFILFFSMIIILKSDMTLELQQQGCNNQSGKMYTGMQNKNFKR